MPRVHAGRDRRALPLLLLLVVALIVGCASRGGHLSTTRPTNTEVVLVARGSLNGLLVPTG